MISSAIVVMVAATASVRDSGRWAESRPTVVCGMGVALGELWKLAVDRGWESDPQHPFHNLRRVVPDLVVGEGSHADRTLERPYAAIIINAAPATATEAVGPVIDQASRCSHHFLVSYLLSVSA